MNWKLRTIILLAFSIFGSSLFGQSQPDKQTPKLIKEISKAIKKESIVKEKIDWNKLELDLKSVSYSGKHSLDKEKIYDVFTKVLRNAGDNHSIFITKQIANDINKSIANEEFSTSKYIGNNIGYIKIPRCMTFDYNKDLKFANILIKQIETLDNNNIDKWIIDLRNNGGGNRYPMLSGLAPIIGNGLVGYSIKSNKYIPEKIKNGTINFSSLETVKYTTKNPYKKIAVLINEKTGSSGEMVAIALLGFERIKSFGQESGGFTTVNSTKDFKDGSQLFLATGYSADKNRKIYYPSIKPDFPLEKSLSEDEIIERVKAWLLTE